MLAGFNVSLSQHCMLCELSLGITLSFQQLIFKTLLRPASPNKAKYIMGTIVKKSSEEKRWHLYILRQCHATLLQNLSCAIDIVYGRFEDVKT